MIPENALGIYRYIDINGLIIKIGEGLIKTRAKDSDRSDWSIHEIQYSILTSKDDCLNWENYYIQRHVDEFGQLPLYNSIKK